MSDPLIWEFVYRQPTIGRLHRQAPASTDKHTDDLPRHQATPARARAPSTTSGTPPYTAMHAHTPARLPMCIFSQHMEAFRHKKIHPDRKSTPNCTKLGTNTYSVVTHRNQSTVSAAPSRFRARVEKPPKWLKSHKIAARTPKTLRACFCVPWRVLSYRYACDRRKNSGSHRQKWANAALRTPNDPYLYSFQATSWHERPTKTTYFHTPSTFLGRFQHAEHVGVVGSGEFARQVGQNWRFMGQKSLQMTFEFF